MYSKTFNRFVAALLTIVMLLSTIPLNMQAGYQVSASPANLAAADGTQAYALANLTPNSNWPAANVAYGVRYSIAPELVVSSTEFPTSNAIDGNYGTEAIPGNPNFSNQPGTQAWNLVVELPEPAQMNTVKIYNTTNVNGIPNCHTLLLSDDGKVWRVTMAKFGVQFTHILKLLQKRINHIIRDTT